MTSLMNVLRLLFVLGALTAVAGCNSKDKKITREAPPAGDTSGSGDGSGSSSHQNGSIKGSCSFDSGICVEFMGSGYNDERMGQACGEGQIASGNCPANAVGTCRFQAGTPAEFVLLMYRVTSEEARQACTMQGGQPV